MKFSKVSKFSLKIPVAAVLMAGFATSPTPSRAECNPVCQQKCRSSYWRADTGVGTEFGDPGREQSYQKVNRAWNDYQDAREYLVAILENLIQS
jgi:hypothetical protein